ncbi:MAG: response regulator transcription factor [Lachnospiraceae bacterium]|nr:response regulator transcription factor [Lachnospiraceae bacterium]
MSATLLLIDDDAEVLEMNGKYLASQKFSVFTASNPMVGLNLAKKKKPDLIVLDVMMPGMDGYELCTKIRQFSNVPIIFLTGKSSEDDKIRGLVTGGDDYIIKPYSLKELKARIDALLRRAGMLNVTDTDKNRLDFGDLKIDMALHKAFYLDSDLQLTNREYDILMYFCNHPNKIITFEELGTQLFGVYNELDRRTIMVNVSRLRKKMNVDYSLYNMIETVWSQGYKFIVRSTNE